MGAIGSILIKAGRLQSITNHEGLLLVPGKNSIWRPLSCFAFAASYGGATSATIDFPPPWTVEELDACFVVRDQSGQQLACVCFENERGRRSAAKLLKLPELLARQLPFYFLLLFDVQVGEA